MSAATSIHAGESWDERLLNYLLFGFAFTLPLAICISEPLAFATVPVWLYGVMRSRKTGLRRNPYLWPVVAFACVALMVSLWGVRPEISVRKCHRLWLLCLIFILSDAFDPLRPGGWSRAVRAMTLFISGATLLGIMDIVRVTVLVARGVSLYDTGNMRDPQMYLVALCMLLALLLTRRSMVRPAWTWSALMLNTVGLVLHFKRGAWFAFGLTAGLMGAWMKRWRVLVVLVLCGVGLLCIPQTRERLGMLQREWSKKQGGRYVLWKKVAPKLIKKYPLGMGLGAVRYEDLARRSPYVQTGLNHLHNNALQVTLETGWPGLAVWVVWMGMAFTVMARAAKASVRASPEVSWMAVGVFSAFTGLMLNGVVEYNFGDSEILMLLCLLMGISCVVRARLSSQAEADPA